MSTSHWRWTAPTVGLLLGLAAGFGILMTLPSMSLPPNHSALRRLGIHKPEVIGFTPYWLLDNTQPESLQKLTNATYFGLTLNPDGTIQRQTNPQENEPGWNKLKSGGFSELLQNHQQPIEKSLLVHLSTEAAISQLLEKPEIHAATMIDEVEPLMKEHSFTDLNLDIESFRDASPSARTAMSTFLTEVKRHLDERELGTLTTELTVPSLSRHQILDPIVVGQVSDRVVLMAYDYKYRDSFISGAVAPTGGAGDKSEHDVSETVTLAIKVIPAEKIILGIPIYGYEWEALSNEPEQPVVPGTGKTATTLRVKELLASCGSDCVKGRDEITGSPYVILPPNDDSSYQQIFYEDETSLAKKIELAKQHQLGGVAFWALGYEPTELLNPVADYKEKFWWRD